jgi:hypothetical protein
MEASSRPATASRVDLFLIIFLPPDKFPALQHPEGYFTW